MGRVFQCVWSTAIDEDGISPAAANELERKEGEWETPVFLCAHFRQNNYILVQG